jgi:2',3'-cyclic-nucleotide 2'-phosphodiesterase (5'-nucleotidase family)
MLIQYASDLHLEFQANSHYLIDNPLEVTGEILILAGDIHVFNSDDFLTNPFWDWASQNYKQVIVAYGNHEFYKGYDLSELKDGFKYKIRENVYYYYNCVISLDDIDIIVSTLWSHISEKNKIACELSVNDFRLIKIGKNTLTAETFNEEHKKCLDFIKKSMNESKAKTKIIVTHHVPSNLLTAKEFEGSDINEAFTVDLTDYIKKCGAKYWIFGHSHRNINKIIGETACLCNQVGYVMSNEHLTFVNSKSIDLNKPVEIQENITENKEKNKTEKKTSGCMNCLIF